MIRILAGLLILSGISLHIYELQLVGGDADRGPLLLFLWSCVPYAILLAALRNKPCLALGGVVAVIIVDLWSHNRVFVEALPEVAALQQVFTPFWNLFVIMPLGMWAGLWICKKLGYVQVKK